MALYIGFVSFLARLFLIQFTGGYVNARSVIGHNVTVSSGEDAHLNCQMLKLNEPMTSATWQRRTKEMPQNYDFFIMTLDHNEHNYLGERVKFTGNFSGLLGSILLRNVSLQDEGIYTCILNIFPSGPYETELYLTVLVPPVVTVNVAVHPVAGDTDELLPTCTAANSKPAAEVSWNLGALRDSVEVQITHTVDSEGRYTVTSSLISKKSKDLKQENVHCLVSHPGLKEKLNCTLAIHYPPQVVYISPSGPTEFHCKADAHPKPTYFSWSRCLLVKEPLSSGDTNTLIIQPTPDSHGCYYCMASDQHGKSICFFNSMSITYSICKIYNSLDMVYIHSPSLSSGLLYFCHMKKTNIWISKLCRKTEDICMETDVNHLSL